jgi:hypothetical protein
VTLKLTPAPAAALGVIDRKPPRQTRKTAGGLYHSRCCHCPETFTTQVGETRHVESTGHTRYDTLTETETS